MKLAVFLPALLFVSSAMADAGQFHADMQAAIDRCDAQYQSADLAQIFGKIPTRATAERTFSMLVSEDLATPADKPAIEVLAAIYEKCRQDYAQVHRAHGLISGASALLGLSSQAQALFADLHRGAVTYGHVNRTLKQLAADAEAVIYEEYARADQAAESERRQQKAQEAQATGIFLQEMANQLQRPRPTTTTCQKVGLQVQCTTR